MFRFEWKFLFEIVSCDLCWNFTEYKEMKESKRKKRKKNSVCWIYEMKQLKCWTQNYTEFIWQMPSCWIFFLCNIFNLYVVCFLFFFHSGCVFSFSFSFFSHGIFVRFYRSMSRSNRRDITNFRTLNDELKWLKKIHKKRIKKNLRRFLTQII